MTPFGKELRKWRIDHNMLLGEMASRVGCSSSYLSQIEKGHKPIPDGFVDRLASEFGFDIATNAAVRNAAIQSTNVFTLRVTDPSDRELVNGFVTEFARLTPDMKDEIRKAMGMI